MHLCHRKFHNSKNKRKIDKNTNTKRSSTTPTAKSIILSISDPKDLVINLLQMKTLQKSAKMNN